MLVANLRLHLILFLLFSTIEFRLMAQEETPIAESTDNENSIEYKKEYYLLSPRVSVTVPHPVYNKAFKKTFVGVYEFSSGLNFYLYKGLFIGGTYKNGLLRITENKIADYNADMTINNIGGKIGSDFYVGEKNKIIFSVALTFAQNYTHYYGIVAKNESKPPKNLKYKTSLIEPEINLFFLVEPNFGIGATVSYSIFNTVFNPYDLCLDDWTSFPADNPGKTQYLSFGFGFYYSLIKKNKKAHGGY